jgi:branched-chain amino acid transport system substrate-binding protein
LPGDAQKVGLLIPQLAFHNIKDTVLLGTSGWDTPDLVRLAGPYAEGATFIDGFFRESPELIVREYVRRYRLKFQQEPDLFAAQAYDATRLILSALEGGAMTSQEIREAISKSKNFPGASGLIYEVKEGEIVKKPFFVQVHKKKFVQVEELEEDLPPASLEEGEISERQAVH